MFFSAILRIRLLVNQLSLPISFPRKCTKDSGNKALIVRMDLNRKNFICWYVVVVRWPPYAWVHRVIGEVADLQAVAGERGQLDKVYMMLF